MQITIDLTEEQTERLKGLADSLGVEPELLARAACEDLLSHPTEEFRQAASYVFAKNKELYERLS